MSISELNHLMTYVLDGWLLFSAGFVSIGFISFVSKRIQEDLEAEALALAQAETETVAETESVVETDAAVEQAEVDVAVAESEAEEARLKEVAAVSEELAKTKAK
ncbi:MAG: hypothetical protein AAGL17_22870, partial [Cyanobacteria bacterium J06576_12]